MAEEQPAAPESQEAQPVFNFEKVFVKDLSLEVPNAPQIFLERETPQVGVELRNTATQVGDGIFEAVITVTVTSKMADKTVFLVEVAQAGIFQIRNIPAENIDGILGVTCPNILFPYARETISDLITRAGFTAILLNPINFEALYAQQLQQQAESAGATTH